MSLFHQIPDGASSSISPGFFGDDERSPFSGVSTITIQVASEQSTSRDSSKNNNAILGACLRCKSLKVKCELKNETDPCKRCLNGGHDCVSRGRRKRRTPPKSELLLDQIRDQAKQIEKLITLLDSQESNEVNREANSAPVSTNAIKSGQDSSTDDKIMLGACLRCKSLKVKCELKNETDSCKRCLNGGHDCVRGRRKRRTPPKREFLLKQIRDQAKQIEKLTALLDLHESNKVQDKDNSALAKFCSQSIGTGLPGDSTTSGNYWINASGKLASELEDADVETLVFPGDLNKGKGSGATEQPELVALPLEVPFSYMAGNEGAFRSDSVPDLKKDWPLPIASNSIPTELATQVFGFLSSQDPWKLLSKLNLTLSWANGVMQIVQNELDRSVQDLEHGEYGRKCMRVLRQMAQHYGVLPPSFLLGNLAPAGNHAVCGGGFSDIWKGKLCDQDVCIKVLRVFTTTKIREELLKQFCHEAIIWGQLKHPNILPFLGVSFDLFDPSFCLVSPWMENGNVLQFLEINSTYDRMTVIREVAEGLKYLHAFNPPVVHGDIRGANILVKSDLHFCLADFGLAAVVESQIFTTTRTDNIGGTTRWMAPEVLLPLTSDRSINATPFRDIYAFACTVLELCTGRVPFYEDRLDITVAHKVLGGQRPQRPSPDIWFPDELWDLVQTCWVEDPAGRPTAAEVVELLGQAHKRLSEH